MLMNSSQQRAYETRRRYRLNRPEDIDRVLEAENLLVIPFPLKGRVNEMMYLNRIALPLDFDRNSPMARELLAHALGHHLLHSGNQLYYHLHHDWIISRQMERQAWDFAFELFIPHNKLARMVRHGCNESDLQDHFQVSEDFFRKRMQAFRGEPFRDPHDQPLEIESMESSPLNLI
jgi:Zn-dependent peptidase ImmA (M78 family)